MDRRKPHPYRTMFFASSQMAFGNSAQLALPIVESEYYPNRVPERIHAGVGSRWGQGARRVESRFARMTGDSDF